MSQRELILKRLQEAGPRGVHSFQLLDITPRYAARICELNKLGHVITSEPERRAEAIGVRYTLNVGVGAEGDASSSREARGLGDTSPLSTDSGVECSASHIPPRPGASSAPPATPNPYEYEVMEDAA